MKSKLFNAIFYATLVGIFCVASFPLFAQTAGSQHSDVTNSWTATTEPQVSVDVNPTRMTETHTQTGDRTVDIQSVERLGPGGQFEPYVDIEKETIRVNATTIRTVVRTFGRDGGGQRALSQVREEATETLPSGGEKVVSTLSAVRGDGRLAIVQQDVTDKQKKGPGLQESKTTVFLSDGSGGLAPLTQIRERQRRAGDHTLEVQKTTLLLDGSGNWQVHELEERTIRDNGKDRNTEERVSLPEYDGGKLSLFSYSAGRASESGSGERHDSRETYSADIPGTARDGNLHLTQRLTTVRRPHSDGGQATEEELEQLNPGNPRAGLQGTSRTMEIVSPDDSGVRQTRTIQVRDGSGKLRVISTEIRKSNQIRAVQVDTAPQDRLR